MSKRFQVADKQGVVSIDFDHRTSMPAWYITR